MTNLRKKFRQWQNNHPNFITPNLEKQSQRNNYIIELSSGRDIDDSKMFGVSVYEHTPENEHSNFTAPNHDLNKPFHDREEAMAYFNMLKKQFKNYNSIKKIVNEVEN